MLYSRDLKYVLHKDFKRYAMQIKNKYAEHKIQHRLKLEYKKLRII